VHYHAQLATSAACSFAQDSKEIEMAITVQRNLGLLLLAIWLILYGVAGLTTVVLPAMVMAVLALVSGILILVGR
jgi:uncharacterized membrane protein